MYVSGVILFVLIFHFTLLYTKIKFYDEDGPISLYLFTIPTLPPC